MLLAVVIFCSAASAGLLVLSTLTANAAGKGDALALYERALEQARRRAEKQREKDEAEAAKS